MESPFRKCQTLICKSKDLSIRRQCQLLGVNRASLYYQHVEPAPAYLELQEELMRRIDYWHTKMPYLGSRKIAQRLQEKDGYNVGRKTVRRLMQQMAIYAIYPKQNLSKRNFKEAVVPYLLRNYPVNFPNQVWSIDITYVPMPHGHMFLTAIIDWYSRKILGHYLSDTLDTASVITAVKEAVHQHGTPAIINSDQGSQFTSKEYKNLLKELHIRQSMDGRSRWADNIMIERWFRSLKHEKLYYSEYNSPRELRQVVNSYIKEYNTERPHESLNYQTPNDVYYNSFAA